MTFDIDPINEIASKDDIIIFINEVWDDDNNRQWRFAINTEKLEYAYNRNSEYIEELRSYISQLIGVDNDAGRMLRRYQKTGWIVVLDFRLTSYMAGQFISKLDNDGWEIENDTHKDFKAKATMDRLSS